jgi:6-phosphogluconolactonase (cycloisomerase 2 family)
MKFTKFGKALLMSALSAGVVLSITSCVQSYSVGFLYVTSTVTAKPDADGIITGFKIDHNTGKLTQINGLPVSSGGANPVRAILLNGSRFLYVLNRGYNSAGTACTGTGSESCSNAIITQFAVGGNGVLTPQESFPTQGLNPFRMIADASGNYVYVLEHDAPLDPGSNANQACQNAFGTPTCGDITAFQVNQTTGRLQLVVNAQVSSANCSTSSANCPLPYFPVPANPIDFVLSSSTILTVSGTPTTGDSVFPYTYNGGNGQLTISQNTSQPLNIKQATAIVNGSTYVYVLDNEPISVNGTVASQSQIVPYSIGTGGALQSATSGPIPDDPTQANPTYMLLESKGKWLYVANQGNNNTTTSSTYNGITGYVLVTSPYSLTEMPGLPFGTGSGPQCIVEDPSNQFIYTANFNDSTVTGRVIDQNAGVLTDLRVTGNGTYSLTGPATWCLVDGRTS